MTKTLVVTMAGVVSFASIAFGSHLHQALCVVTATQPDGDVIQFLLQTESSREYVNGNPDKDVHDFRYQVRVCDDDNDSSRCSTYKSKTVSHAATDEITLVGMKDKTAVFFRGKISSDGMDGKIIHQGAQKKRWCHLRPSSTSVSVRAGSSSCPRRIVTPSDLGLHQRRIPVRSV